MIVNCPVLNFRHSATHNTSSWTKVDISNWNLYTMYTANLRLTDAVQAPLCTTFFKRLSVNHFITGRNWDPFASHDATSEVYGLTCVSILQIFCINMFPFSRYKLITIGWMSLVLLGQLVFFDFWWQWDFFFQSIVNSRRCQQCSCSKIEAYVIPTL